MNDELLEKIKENNLTIEEWLKMRVTEEYEKALMNKIDDLQSNWNSLREWLKNSTCKDAFMYDFIAIKVSEILDKMNELEGVDNEND